MGLFAGVFIVSVKGQIPVHRSEIQGAMGAGKFSFVNNTCAKVPWDRRGGIPRWESEPIVINGGNMGPAPGPL